MTFACASSSVRPTIRKTLGAQHRVGEREALVAEGQVGQGLAGVDDLDEGAPREGGPRVAAGDGAAEVAAAGEWGELGGLHDATLVWGLLGRRRATRASQQARGEEAQRAEAALQVPTGTRPEGTDRSCALHRCGLRRRCLRRQGEGAVGHHPAIAGVQQVARASRTPRRADRDEPCRLSFGAQVSDDVHVLVGTSRIDLGFGRRPTGLIAVLDQWGDLDDRVVRLVEERAGSRTACRTAAASADRPCRTR